MSNRETPFGPKNWLFLAIFTGVIVLGFGLMALESGKGFIDAKEFSMSLYISPVLIIGGFAGVIFAILIKPDMPLEAEPVSKRRTSSRRGGGPGEESTSTTASTSGSSRKTGGSSRKKSSRR